MLPSLFPIQIINYRVAQGLTIMKTSPVVLLTVYYLKHLHLLDHLWRADPHRGSQVWCRVVIEVGNKRLSNERPSGVHACRRNRDIDQPCQTPRQTNSDVQGVCA